MLERKLSRPLQAHTTANVHVSKKFEWHYALLQQARQCGSLRLALFRRLERRRLNAIRYHNSRVAVVTAERRGHTTKEIFLLEALLHSLRRLGEPG